jgi:hypothetical protein
MSKRYAPVSVEKGEVTSHGFYRVPASFTRTGVFAYKDKDGNIRRELRHPDDVFNEDSVKTLRHAPLTLKHPEQFVDVDNVKEHSTGHLGDTLTYEDGRHLRGMVLITDKNAIAEAQKGTVELSCGYTADLIDEAGTYEGEPYDCRQTNIRYNHVAQVERGRAGPSARLHLDADDRVQVTTPKVEDSMESVTIDGKEFQVPPEVAALVKQAQEGDGDETMDAKMKAKDAEIKAKEEEAEKAKEDAKKSVDTLQAKIDSLEEEKKQRKDSAMTPDQINKSVKARMKIDRVAQSVLGGEYREDASDMDLIKQVVAKKSSMSMEGKSEDYLRARFDHIAEDDARREDTRETLARSFGGQRKDEDYDVETARSNQSKNAGEAWMQPLAASKKE